MFVVEIRNVQGSKRCDRIRILEAVPSHSDTT